MRVVIIGSGPAGVTVAETLRQYGSQAEIIMFSDEPYPPYSPPAMVEYFLSGRKVHFWKGEDFPERLEVDYRPGTRVTRIEPKRKSIFTEAGTEVPYDVLVIASGGRLYAPVDGADKAGIHNFKSLSAAEALIQTVRTGQARSALIVGAGFIGVELALLLLHQGVEVTMLVRSRVMRRMLDPESSELVLEMLLERGVKVRRGEAADAVAFVGEKKAKGVQVRSGEVLTADILIAATGLRPNVEFLKGSGIPVNWGVLVDENLRAGFPNVYAAGDVVESVDYLTGKRFVNAIFPNAVAQGRVVALNILGRNVAYKGSDSMNSLKHLGLPVMAVGLMEGEELTLRRGKTLRKIYLKDNRIVGFRLVGDISGAGIYRALLNRRIDVSGIKERLLAPKFGMGYLIPQSFTPPQCFWTR